MLHPYHSKACIEHPLGILCRCAEYDDITNKFIIYTVGTQHPLVTSLNIDPISSEKVIWLPTRTEPNVNPTKPILSYEKSEKEKIDSTNVKKRWIPVATDVVSPNELRPNMSYLHNTERHTQSADTSTLTDMLPHKGRVIRRKDIDWEIGSHETPVKMSDEPETNWRKINGCFCSWADAFTISMFCPPY
ncbi:uncharacterized protein LOC107267504 [Cephus cinctus]|uniref:Uncharacterized protein LOC107267504 n=1 Tax=Cephus cinctus TaxID=211228 RepID=A0AAJ7RGV0_CEPCN|nr:uncharacterized protein LOC107267504 [Cephus cinctus]